MIPWEDSRILSTVCWANILRLYSRLIIDRHGSPCKGDKQLNSWWISKSLLRKRQLLCYIGNDGIFSFSSPSSQCGLVQCGTLSVPLLRLQRRWNRSNLWSDHIRLSSCVIGEYQGVWLDWLHDHSVHSLGHPWLPSFLLSLCLATEEKPSTVCGKENIFLSLPCQVFGTLCMAVGSSLRCLPLLFPALKSSFTGCCHAGKHFPSSS